MKEGGVMQIKLDTEEFIVEIEHKKIKNMYLRIKTGNVLMISAHPHVPEEQIKNFIVSKKQWILSANDRVKNKNKLQENKGVNQSKIQYLGEIKELQIVKATKNAIKIEEDKIVLWVKEENQAQIIFENLVKKELLRYIIPYQDKFNAIMDDYRLPHPTVSFRKMTSKWGSCIPKKAKITLNVNLIYMPMECLIYVLLHEYAHMIVPNHSKRFYEVIGFYMPEYKKIQKILKEK